MSRALTKHLDLFLLFFDDLIHDFRRSLLNLAYFLGVELSPEILNCAVSHAETDIYKRKWKVEFYKEAEVKLDDLAQEQIKVKNLIEQCLKERRCMTSGCGFVDL